MNKTLISAALGLMALAVQPAQSQENAGFLTDYSLLTESPENRLVDQVYIAPGALERLKEYSSIAVDQPEIFISPDSKYKGIKPDNVKQLADLIRASIIGRLDEGGFPLADRPGPGVLYLRVGLTDVHIKKKSRGLLGYTPIGFVVTSTMQAAAKELAKKITIVQMNTEIELLDGASGEVLGAAVFKRGQIKDKDKGQKREIVSWEEFEAYMSGVGDRVRCRIENSRKPESDWEDCAAIPIEIAAEEEG